MKFGGTSVENAERIRSGAGLVAEQASQHQVLVVVSALAKTTDQILACTQAAARGDEQSLAEGLKTIQRRHEGVVAELFGDSRGDKVRDRLESLQRQLHDFCFALLQLRSITPQLLDVALPMGEKMSAQIFSAVLAEMGTSSVYVDSASFLITDDRFGDATADLELTEAHAERVLRPLLQTGSVPVVTGYSGITSKGQPTTLGRGGSDSSATIAGSVLRCDEIWIWTDVDGVLSTDPRISPEARILEEISFAEAIELSYYGAKVIHHKAVRPAMERGIPVRIKNSFRPQVPGTRIGVSAARGDGPIKAVTAIPKATLITVCARHDLYIAADVLGRLFLRLGHEHVDVLFSTQSSAENSLGLVLRGEDTDRVLASIERLFRSEIKHGVLRGVDVVRDLAVIAVMGESMKGVPGILARLFTSVARCNVSVIAAAQGASELSICFAVPAGDASTVVKEVHDEFFVASQTHA
jgi:aspartate kinase